MKDCLHFSMRIDEILLRKFEYIAKYEGRSINAMLLFVVRKCVAEFEKSYGSISL